MKENHLPWAIVHVVLFASLLDSVMTLLGQPPVYWFDHSQVREWAPHARLFLQAGPPWFLAGALAYCGLLALLLRKLPLSFSVPLSVFFLAGHTVGFSTWAEKFFQHEVGAGTGLSYYLTFAFVLAACVIVGIVVRIVLKRRRLGLEPRTKLSLVLPIAFLTFVAGIDLSFCVARILAVKRASRTINENVNDKILLRALWSVPEQSGLLSAEKLIRICRSNRGSNVRTNAIYRLGGHLAEPGVVEALLAFLEDRNVAVREAAIRTLRFERKIPIPEDTRTALARHRADEDMVVAIGACSHLWRGGQKEALRTLLELLPRTTNAQERQLIARTIKGLYKALDMDEFLDLDGEAVAKKWLAWFEENRDRIVWDAGKKTFTMPKGSF